MSRLYKMTWEKSKQRWRKMYHGRIYTVSPQSLGCPPTKDESYQAANGWWEAKLTEIKGQPSTRFEHLVKELEALRGTSDLPRGYDYLINYVRRSASDTSIPESEVREIVPPSENLLLWGEILSGVKKPTPADRTIGHWVGRFLALRMDEVTGKELSIAQYELVRLCLDKFKEWIGDDTSIDKIAPDRWVDWYRHLLTLDISVEYKKKRLANARNFISWLIEHGLIPGFASLFAKRYKFGNDKEEVKPVDREKIKSIIDTANGRLKLVLLLMANAGMNQIDIANLKPSEYKDGRITRSRSKTKKQGTRVVSWKLWDTTRHLLDQYGETSGDRLFLTETKRAWVRDDMIDGRRSKTDAAQSVYRHLKTGVTLKQIRQTSGDMIKRKFGKPVADHFLAHGQKPVDASYFSREQEVLDDAVAWLGAQYGIV
jgi:site-specific recombinase XerD